MTKTGYRRTRVGRRLCAAEISEAFWQARHGGQRRAAKLLLARGVDLNAATGHSHETPLAVAGSSASTTEVQPNPRPDVSRAG